VTLAGFITFLHQMLRDTDSWLVQRKVNPNHNLYWLLLVHRSAGRWYL